MWLACALIVLFSVGFVLPCMLDITTTPDSEFVTFSKGTWLFLAGAFWILGAAAWLIVGRPRRVSFHLHLANPYPAGGFGPEEALLRHPAAQAAAASYSEPLGALAGLAPRVLGPDDDPDFLDELTRRIREEREGALFSLVGNPELRLAAALAPSRLVLAVAGQAA
jgi:hypothetical protein